MSIHKKLLERNQVRTTNQEDDQSIPNHVTTNNTPFFSENNTPQLTTQESDKSQTYHPIKQDWATSGQPNAVHNTSEKDTIEEIKLWADNFNSSKTFLRPTTDCFPKTKKLMEESKFKFSIAISPFGSQDATFPVATMKAKNIIRCSRCRTYLNPFFKFIADGYKFSCNICDGTESVPNFFYSPLDRNGYRTDFSQKPELSYGSFDIIAGEEYSSRSPMPPTFIFMIDVSKAAVESGMLAVVANTIKETINNDALAGEERTQVGIVTFDTNVHIYSLKSSLKQPQMFVLSDPNETDFPIPDELLVTLKESKDLVYSLLESMPKMFENTLNTGSCFTLALDIAGKMIKPVGGRLFIFQASPSLITEPVFACKNEVKKSQPGENVQYQQQIPSTSHFRNLCSEMHSNFINASIFIFSDTFKNAINLGEMARYLNGDLFYYYDKLTNRKQLQSDLKHTLEKEMSWESVFRIRITAGFRISNINGNFTIKSTDLLSFPCDENKTLIYDVEMDDTIIRGNNLSIQTALLYTNSSGQRRIRSHNYIIPLTSDIQYIYNNADGAVLAASLARPAIFKMYYQPATNIKSDLIAATKKIYFTSCSINRTQLHFNLSQLPLCILGVLKHSIFTSSYPPNQIGTDIINCQRIQLNCAPIDELITHFIPYLFCIDEMVGEEVSFYDQEGIFIFPSSCSISYSSLGRTMYLMDIGSQLLLYINPLESDQNLIMDVIGTTDFNQEMTEDSLYANGRNKINEQLANLISELRKRKSTKDCPLTIIVAGFKHPLEQLFYYKLIEDKNTMYTGGYNASYADFINILS